MTFSKEVLDGGVLLVNVLLMVMVGIELQPRHFALMAQRKGIVAILFAGQVLLLPLLGLLVAWALSLPPPIAAGILLLAACPVGDIANLYTLIGRGNLALSVAMNAGTCLLSTATMTMVFQLYDLLLGGRFVFAVPPPALLGRLLLMIVLPVLAGVLLRRQAPAWALARAALFRNASVAGVILLIVYVLVTQQRLLSAEWGVTAIAGGVFMVLALSAGTGLAWFLKLPLPDIITAGIFFSVRNVSIAMAIAVTLLQRVDYAVFAVVYFLAEVPLLLAFAGMARRRQESGEPENGPEQPG